MRNIIYVSLFVLIGQMTMAQMGINTDRPQAALDVRGDLSIRNKIYVGGNDQFLGDHGKKGQVLVSQGANKPPVWKTLNIPNYQSGDFYMIFNDAYLDNQGVTFNAANEIGGNPLYSKNEERSNAKFNKWKDIAGLNQDFIIHTSQSKVFITYEAVVQISDQGTGYVDFACGVFVDDKLKGVRVETIKQASQGNHPFLTFLMVIVAEDLADGQHKAKVSCARLRNSNYAGSFSVGRAVETNINNFVAQSSLKIEVYEIPEDFVLIVD